MELAIFLAAYVSAGLAYNEAMRRDIEPLNGPMAPWTMLYWLPIIFAAFWQSGFRGWPFAFWKGVIAAGATFLLVNVATRFAAAWLQA